MVDTKIGPRSTLYVIGHSPFVYFKSIFRFQRLLSVWTRRARVNLGPAPPGMKWFYKYRAANVQYDFTIAEDIYYGTSLDKCYVFKMSEEI